MQETATNWLASSFPTLEATEFRGELTLVVPRDKVREVISTLKGDPKLNFNLMADLFAVDYSTYPTPMPERFSVIYNLYSMGTGRRVFLKVWVSEQDSRIASIHDLYAAANWFEREAWDLFGIHFTGHPNLSRILCHAEFEGHALRKDYPADHYQRLKRASPSGAL